MALSRRAHNRRQKAREYLNRRLALHQYDDLSDVLRDMEHELEWAPSRSTFYAWAKDWQDQRNRDRSGAWTLASDTTGRPDIVMGVLAALIGASGGRRDTISVAEARWVVRLAVALPTMLQDGVWRCKGEEEWPAWGAVRVWEWAANYIDAEMAGDTEALQELDAKVAVLYANEGRHFAELVADEEGKQRNVREIRAANATEEG